MTVTVKVEECDECSGTRWPISKHDEHCSLHSLNAVCTICGQRTEHDAKPAKAGDHDPAYHVAKAYHSEHHQRCSSCGEAWPCKTVRDFSY